MPSTKEGILIYSITTSRTPSGLVQCCSCF